MRHTQPISIVQRLPARAEVTLLGTRALFALLTDIANFAGIVASLVKGAPAPAGEGEGEGEGDGHDDEH